MNNNDDESACWPRASTLWYYLVAAVFASEKVSSQPSFTDQSENNMIYSNIGDRDRETERQTGRETERQRDRQVETKRTDKLP